MPIVPTPECAIQFQSEVNGLGSTDIVHFVGPSGQIVSWIDFDGIGQGGLTVSPASSILFQNVIGNISVAQMNSGLNANPSTFFRGDGTWSQVQFTNIPGIANPSQIPNISAGKLTSGLVATSVGGTGVDLSTSGSATAFLAENASHIISARSIAATDVPVLPASIITSGQLALAQGGTGVNLSSSGGANLILAQDGSHVISARALVAADVPSLPASQIGSGILALNRGGTGVDLSASGAAHNFLTQNASHVISAAQPAFSDISGTATSGQYVVMVGDSGSGGVQGAVPAPPSGSAAAGKFLKADGTFAVPASSGLTLETNTVLNGSQTLLNLHGGANVTLTDNGSGQITINSSSTGGTIALDTNNSANSSQAVLSLNNGTGIVTANPTSGNVTFTLQPASAGTIGGVNSLSAVTSNWIDSISTLGVPHASQPAFTDISGTAATGQIPNLAASKITSGQLALSQGGTGVDLSASGSSTAFLAQNASQVVSARSIASTDVPALDASKITTGQIGLAQGGTGVDLSAAGGTSNFLAINGSHVISAAQPTLSDILGTGNLLPSVAGTPNIGSVSLPFGQIFANQFIVPSGSSAFLVGTEGNSPVTPQAGNDILYLGDINSHTAQVSNNGNSFQSIATWDTTTPTVHGVVVAGNFPAFHTSGPGTSGQVLTSNGAGSDPTFQTANAALPVINSSAQGKILTNNGSISAWSGPTLDCTQFSSAGDMSQAIQACTAALSTLSTIYGVADARGFVGNQTFSVDPLGGTAPKGGILLLGGATITQNVPIKKPRNWTIQGGPGSFSVPGQNGTALQASGSFQTTYSTGTVTINGTGNLTVTGSGTAWTTNMQGCVLAAGPSIKTGAASWGIINTVNVGAQTATLYYNGAGAGVAAGSPYAIYCPMIVMGTGVDGNNEQGGGLQYLDINCQAVAGAIGVSNYFAEEGSWIDHIGIRNCNNIGLDIESQYTQNSGPYTNIDIGSVACPSSFLALVIRNNSAPIRHFSAGTIGCSGQAVAIDLESYQVHLRDLQMTGGTVGIEVSGQVSCPIACVVAGSDARNVHLSNIWGGGPGGTTLVDLSTAIAAPVNLIIEDLGFVGNWTNTLIDHQNSCTLTSYLGFYALNRSGGIGYSTAQTAGCYAKEAVASLSTPSHLLISSTAPTITSHFNTSGDSISSNNGTTSFQITVGTGAGTHLGVIGLPTATSGWNCFVTNTTRAAQIQAVPTTSSSVTIINFGTTFANTNWTNSDVLQCSCFAY